MCHFFFVSCAENIFWVSLLPSIGVYCLSTTVVRRKTLKVSSRSTKTSRTVKAALSEINIKKKFRALNSQENNVYRFCFINKKKFKISSEFFSLLCLYSVAVKNSPFSDPLSSLETFFFPYFLLSQKQPSEAHIFISVYISEDTVNFLQQISWDSS